MFFLQFMAKVLGVMCDVSVVFKPFLYFIAVIKSVMTLLLMIICHKPCLGMVTTIMASLKLGTLFGIWLAISTLSWSLIGWKKQYKLHWSLLHEIHFDITKMIRRRLVYCKKLMKNLRGRAQHVSELIFYF